MEQFYSAADRRLLRFGAALAGFSLVAFGAVAAFVFRYSVDCFDGNPVTWLFADRAMEAAEAKELSASLAAHPTLHDVAVIRVRDAPGSG